MNIPQAQRKFLWLESSRGVAAIFVVLFHTAAIMNLPKYFGAMPLDGFFKFGYAGVDFFFVLSVFIILYAHMEDINNRKKIRIYFLKRFIRIYPLHWIATAIFIAGLLIYPQRNFPELDLVIRSFLLIPLDGYPLGIVAWTLIHEVMFYFIFGLLIFSRWIGSAAILFWSTGIMFNLFYLPDATDYLQKFIFNIHNLEFLLGMIVALIIRKWDYQSFWKTSAVLGVGVFTFAALMNSHQSENSNIVIGLFALGSALIIYALVCGDLLGLMKKAGFRKMKSGLESANQSTLDRINKNIKPALFV